MTDAATPTDTTCATTNGDGRQWIWRIETTRDVVDCAQFANAQVGPLFDKLVVPADPQVDWRDIRIIELEAALRVAFDAGQGLSAVCSEHEKRAIAYDARIAELEAAFKALCEEIDKLSDAVLMPSPEGDMSITVEELEA